MSEANKTNVRQLHDQEIVPKFTSGMPILLLNIIFMVGALLLLIWGIKFVMPGSSVASGTAAMIIAGEEIEIVNRVYSVVPGVIMIVIGGYLSVHRRAHIIYGFKGAKTKRGSRADPVRQVLRNA